MEFAGEVGGEGRDLDIEQSRGVVAAFGVAVQAIARQIEIQSAPFEKAVEAGRESQENLVRIDDEQGPPGRQARQRECQVVSGFHPPPSRCAAIRTVLGSIRLLSQKSIRSSSFAMRKSTTAARKSRSGARL